MSKEYFLDFNTLESFMKDVFISMGTPTEDAEIVANVLIESDKRGIQSHGVGRFKPIYVDRIKDGTLDPKTNVEIVRDRMTIAVIDGHHGFGHVIGKKAMDMAIEKAKKYGMGMVVVRNSTHYGIAGYYASMATAKGCIGITGTNARPSIAPTFGVENMLGTNPLTFGIPTDEDFDFILDCATSTSQRGKIEVYDRAEKNLPKGWVIDQYGKDVTDIHGILDGLQNGTMALTPLGGLGVETAGFKGFGYATVVEILSSCLQQGAFLKALSGIGEDGNPKNFKLGHFFMAIDVEAFVELDDFKKSVGQILKELRDSKKMPGQERIYTAGEIEHIYYQENKDKGVSLNKKFQETIISLKKECGLNQYKFDFED